MIELYTDATPNGLKVSIALEEVGLEYNTHRLYLGGDQMTDEFTRLNPNQKIPVIKDGDITVTESGAILYYLAEKTGELLPKDIAERTKTIEMLMLQMSGLGPYFGQLLVFAAAWDNKFPAVTERYQKEVNRLLGVMNTLLAGNDYFAGNHYSIADIAFFPWVRMCYEHPIGALLETDKHSNLIRWYETVAKREAVQRGLLVPEPHPPEEQFKAFVGAVVGLGDIHS